ncbi:AAA family ATPase [Thermogladius sp. 4427co]|uniref:AAA family ATPase n=1 Tax=Thermogladius sp. 4427co TaxID=3450718 RepID=UPI003F78BAD7
MLLILVTGMPGSGKSLVANVARELGITVVNMGDIVREETLRKYGRITPELMLEVSIELRKKYGEDYIAVKTVERIPRDSKIVVVDGVRSLAEVSVFKRIGKTVIIAVHASPRTRFERLLKRNRPGDPKNFEEFKKRDIIELGFGIGSVIALADYILVNEKEINKVIEEAKNLISEVIRHGEDNY